jgi:ketosteroid isomerase-like protein
VHIQGTFSAHSGNVQCTFRERSVHIQGTFSVVIGVVVDDVVCTCTQPIYRERSVHIQGTFSAYSGNVQCTFRERSVHIQGTFSAHSGNLQCTFRERSVRSPVLEFAASCIDLVMCSANSASTECLLIVP